MGAQLGLSYPLLCLQISMLFTHSQAVEIDDKLPYEEGSLINSSLGQQSLNN